ncbi:MAG: hypothetical protein GY925_14095 [Actinomycetia bacterium]|nr:hypothetical protein [Actinomycetes bacterium]
MKRRSLRLLATVLAMVLTLTTCGIPDDDEPIPVALPEDFELEPTTTTSTTLPDEIPADRRLIYLIREGLLVQRRREIAEPITTTKAIEALIAGPTDEESESGDETFVDPDMVIETSVDGGVLILDLIGDFTEETPALRFEGESRSLLVGQLVLTGLLGNTDLVGVNFQANGEWLPTVNGEGQLQEVDESGVPQPLTLADFAVLRPGGI